MHQHFSVGALADKFAPDFQATPSKTQMLDQSRREVIIACTRYACSWPQAKTICSVEPYVILLLGQLSGSCSTCDSQMGAGKSINHVQVSSHAQSATGRAPPIHICQCATPRNVRRCSNFSACRCYCNTMSFWNKIHARVVRIS